MKIDERVKKCVAFIQYKMADWTYKYAGTCFFIGKIVQENTYCYVVTAKHVIEWIKSTWLLDAYIRLNLKAGGSQILKIELNSWIHHDEENVDITICSLYFDDTYDHLYYMDSNFLNEENILSNEIDCGDEVFITGLFSYHVGQNRNLPIVRIWNIAMMPTEKVQTKDGLIDAYLIESRSIAWLSGSPVFVNLWSVRKIWGNIKHAKWDMIPPLLGLIYWHFDSESNDIDSIQSSNNEDRKINVGIAIVTPISKLVELLQSQKILDKESAL